jgi:hypothetical protein
MGRCKRPRNHAAPIVSDDMERLRADGVGDSKDIVHETVWTIFSHVERSGTTGIATPSRRMPSASSGGNPANHLFLPRTAFRTVLFIRRFYQEKTGKDCRFSDNLGL